MKNKSLGNIQPTKEEYREWKKYLYNTLLFLATERPELTPRKSDSLFTLLESFFYWADKYNDGYFTEMDDAKIDRYCAWLVEEKMYFYNKTKILREVNDMTAQEKWEEIYDVLDSMNIRYDTNYCDSETEALIEFWTKTAGQDIPTEFDYDGTPEDFVKQFMERAENYNVDDEVELYVNMRGKNGVPNTVRELLDDCQEAKDTLMKIAIKLQETIK